MFVKKRQKYECGVRLIIIPILEYLYKYLSEQE